MRPILPALTLFTLFLATVALSRPVELDDMYRLRQVSEARISPDGEWVAYTVTTPDLERDEEVSDLWMTNWNGEISLQLTRARESEHQPRFSPTGEQLAFLSDRGSADQGDQVWLLDMRGGEARQ